VSSPLLGVGGPRRAEKGGKEIFVTNPNPKSPYLSQKTTDFDEIWYTTSDIESGCRHMTKN